MKWRLLILAIIVAACVVNHVESHFRAKRIRQEAEAADVPVVQMDSNAAGHSSLTIQEGGRQKAGVLQFNTLEAWAFTRDNPPPCPESVTAVDGQTVKIVGFMYPLQDGASVKVFCLLRSTQTCCYGPRPQFNQYLLVETAEPVKFERLAPVVVRGVFHVDAKPREGYIYRIDGASVRSANGNDQPPSPLEVARQADLPLFDIAVLERIQQTKGRQERDKEIERQLMPLDGKRMVFQGYVIRSQRPAASGPDASAATDIRLARYPELKPSTQADLIGTRRPGSLGFDPLGPGRPQTQPAAGGVPARVPDPYNSLRVSLKSEKEIPPVWWPEAIYVGTLRVTSDPADRGKKDKGIVRIEDATLATSPSDGSAGLAVDYGPVLPLLYELLLLGAGLAAVIFGLFRRRGGNQLSNGGLR